jgi:hypothetical protein
LLNIPKKINCDFIGFLEWDGRTFPMPDKIFKNKSAQVVIDSFIFWRTEPYYDLLLMDKHGLYHSLLEITIQKRFSTSC